MVKPLVFFVAGLLLLAPVCILVGYGIGEIIASFVYPAAPPGSDIHRVDRELFAGIYGIMFIGGAMYVACAAFAIFRLVRALRTNRT